MRATWLEVDLAAVRANAELLLRQAGKALMAVVKANGYGLGAVPIARAALEGGASALGVATLQEALELRQAGLQVPILILGFTEPEGVRAARDHDVHVALADPEWAARYGALAPGLGVHLKIDTGMGRFGVRPEKALALYEAASAAGLEVRGVFTHLAAAESDGAFTALQIERFERVLAELRRRCRRPLIVHAENSAGILGRAMPRANMARSGIALLGLSPAGTGEPPQGLRPVLSWKARIVHLKTIEAGESVGYGRTYRASGPTCVATLPFGYADGYPRALSNRAHVLLRGVACPVIGRVSMDQVTVAVPESVAVTLGEEVVVVGQSGEARVTLEQLAEEAGTINYELAARLAPRLPRRYLGEGGGGVGDQA